MIFDDRLETVLRHKPVAGEAGYIQYLQLIDLLGRRAGSPAIPEEALDRLAELEQLLPVEQRALILRGSAPVLRHAELVLRLASQAPSISAVAMAAARLGDTDWAALIPELPAEARADLRGRNDLGPLAQQTLARFAGDELPASPDGEVSSDDKSEGRRPSPDSVPNAAGIAAILQRIETLRRSRGPEPSGAPTSIVGKATAEHPGPIAAVGFISDAAGVVTETDHDCGPMLVGLTLGQRGPAAPARCDAAVITAMAGRGPISAGRLVIDGAARIAGAWRIDASPRFDPASGGFLGYAGFLRRPYRTRPGDAARTEEARVRALQMLHELRTPVHAVQGFAELIHQQLFGPLPHLYAGRAASIAADAAQILAAIEDAGELVAGDAEDTADEARACDLAALMHDLARRLEGTRHSAGYDLDMPEAAVVALGEEAVARLLWRLLAAVASLAEVGERLTLTIAVEPERVVLTASLPARWAASGGQALLSAHDGETGATLQPSALGPGFALRLAAVQAERSGGSVMLADDRLVLHLPRRDASTTVGDRTEQSEADPLATIQIA